MERLLCKMVCYDRLHAIMLYYVCFSLYSLHTWRAYKKAYKKQMPPRDGSDVSERQGITPMIKLMRFQYYEFQCDIKMHRFRPWLFPMIAT